jgi:Cu2+-exporting ATPase
MERLAEITHVLFDKTGTLTLGRPRLINAGEISGESLDIAAGLAAHSRHPLSRALYAARTDVVATFETVTEIPGGGLEATDQRGTWRLGNRAFCLGGTVDGTGNSPYSEVVLACDGREVATFRFEDMLRPDTAETIRSLGDLGLQTAIISGDREPVVAAIARKAGIGNWLSGLNPQGKVAAVARAAGDGAKVLMVGDGINDAPALAAAHVSIAPSTAADIGRQASDFVFMRDSLSSVELALSVSRRAGRLIRENFALAIIYNIIAVPVAIAGYATPLIAAIAMSSSSIIVVVNSLRLNSIGARERQGSQPDARPDAKTSVLAS